MSYEGIMNLGTYMNMQSLGLWNNMSPMGYLGTSLPALSGYGSNLGYNLPFSSVLSNVLEALTTNGVNAQNVSGFRTISPDSELQQELNKLGYGNMLILIPEEYQQQVEKNTENAKKIGETFKKWKANYDTVNVRKNLAQSNIGSNISNQGRLFTSSSHNCNLRNCAFAKRI